MVKTHSVTFLKVFGSTRYEYIYIVSVSELHQEHYNNQSLSELMPAKSQHEKSGDYRASQ